MPSNEHNVTEAHPDKDTEPCGKPSQAQPGGSQNEPDTGPKGDNRDRPLKPKPD